MIDGVAVTMFALAGGWIGKDLIGKTSSSTLIGAVIGGLVGTSFLAQRDARNAANASNVLSPSSTSPVLPSTAGAAPSATPADSSTGA